MQYIVQMKIVAQAALQQLAQEIPAGTPKSSLAELSIWTKLWKRMD
jgi:hypothetical protein